MKKIINYIGINIFLLVLLLVQSCAEEKYVACLDALNKKDYASAIPCLREAVRKEKKSAQGYFYLGKALLEADSAEAAVSALILARELDTANIEIYIMIGDAYVKQNTLSAAIDPYNKAAGLDSLRADIHEKLGDVYYKTRQYTDAATEFRQTIARDTNNLAMFQKLGNLLFKANQVSASLPFLLHFVTRDTTAQKEKLQLVTGMFNTKRFEELIPFAISSLRMNSLTDSTKISLTRILALSYARSRDYANAESTFVLLSQKDSLSAEEYLELARAQKALEKNDDAIASYEKANLKDSTLTGIFYDLGVLYMNKKMYVEAAHAFERKVDTDTSSGYQYASHQNAAVCLMQAKQFNRALDHIKASLTVRPEDLRAWGSLSACYAQMDSTRQQRAANQKVIDLITAGGDSVIQKNKDKLDEAYRIEGIISFQEQATKKEKNYDRALEYLLKGYDSKNCQSNLLIAQCYAVKKDNDSAKKYLCRCFSLCPDNKDVQKLASFLGYSKSDCGK